LFQLQETKIIFFFFAFITMQANSNFDVLGWDPLPRGPKQYVKYSDNPEYHQIMMLGSNHPTKSVFRCSIGCFLGFDVSVLDSGNTPIELCGCEWSCNSPFICNLVQDEKKAKLAVIEAGRKVTSKPRNDFGWFCPGSFTLSIVAKTLNGEEFKSECDIVVLEPFIEELSIEMLTKLDDNQAPELGPLRINSHIVTEEVSGTIGFVQSINAFLKRSCADGSTQIIQTPDTFDTTTTIGIDKCVIKEAMHVNCFEKKTLTTDCVTHLNKMFGNSACLKISIKTNYQTFVAFQPNLDCFSGVTKTFIVKYMLEYFEWGWATNAIRDGMFWKLENPTWQKNTKGDSLKWKPASWNRTLNEQLEEDDWINE